MSGKKFFCDELNKTLTCMNGNIMSCCSGRTAPIYYQNYKGEKITKENFLKLKEEIFNLMDEENIDKTPCKGCFYLRERNENDKISETFNMINVSHWVQCNCGCIYCARHNETRGEITTKTIKSYYYDFLPVLKQLYKENLIDKENLTVCIQGGDISILKEFEPIIKEFLKQGIKKFDILSNNINYKPIIKKLLDKDLTTYNTSLDCGTRETFKKIKKVDKFNDCIKNLKKYARSKHKENISVKYILLEHFNDNKEEITSFVNLMEEIGIKNIEFMLDYKWLFNSDSSQTSLPSHFYELYEYFQTICKEKNIRLGVWPLAKDFIEKTKN